MAGSRSKVPVCVFDAYGTLFDVDAAARKLALDSAWVEKLGAHWQELSAVWRATQLNYSWLRAITSTHVDFWQVTQDGLDYALEQVGLGDEADLRARLLDLYWHLSAFEDAGQMLRELKSKGVPCAILSNGSPDMLAAAVAHAGLGDLLEAVLSVEQVGVFKPDGRVYDLVGNRFGCDREGVLFVSSNGWDVAGAAGYGFATVWVNRAGLPMDRLADRPDHVVDDLSGIVDIALAQKDVINV